MFLFSDLDYEVGLRLRLSYSHYCSFRFDIKTGLFLVKCYNSIVSMRLRIFIFSLCMHLMYTNSVLEREG
jgi:hypothetical protein